MSRIGIVGLGLIGGSLGLEFRAQGHRIIGVSRRTQTCDRALELGIVDEAAVDLAILKPADIIFLCTPIGAVVPTLEAMLPLIHRDAIVTDVASVKAPIVEQARQLWPRFLGGHPMAGTEQQGVEAAQSGLFTNAPYVLTPYSDKDAELLGAIAPLVKQLNSRLYTCTPAAHDRAVARISHLPVMVSASLIQSCMQHPEELNLTQALASSGFRDTSRVGGGNPELGTMMARYNRVALREALTDYRGHLDDLISNLDQEDWDAIAATLHHTQAARPPFLES